MSDNSSQSPWKWPVYTPVNTEGPKQKLFDCPNVNEHLEQIYETIATNEEHFLAMALKQNPHIDLMDFVLYHESCFTQDGRHVIRTWLEEKPKKAK